MQLLINVNISVLQKASYGPTDLVVVFQTVRIYVSSIQIIHRKSVYAILQVHFYFCAPTSTKPGSIRVSFRLYTTI